MAHLGALSLRLGTHGLAHRLVQHLASGQGCAHGRFEVQWGKSDALGTVLKRGITGSFRSVSKEHRHRYCDEFSFRWNECKETDAERTAKAIALSNPGRMMCKEPIRGRA